MKKFIDYIKVIFIIIIFKKVNNILKNEIKNKFNEII